MSLLELIVTFALLGIVSLAVVGLLSTGANSFRRVSTEVSLQYEAQLTMSQLQEYLIDCNGGVCYVGNILYVADTGIDAGGHAVWYIHCFRWDTAKEELYYWKGTVTYDEHSAAACTLPADDSSDWALMSSYVDDFAAEPGTSPTSSTQFCHISLDMTLAGRDYATEQTISMRNPVIMSTANYQAWLQLVCA
jgi:hypothetical protein